MATLLSMSSCVNAVMATPALRALRAAHPQAEIVAEGRPALADLLGVDPVMARSHGILIVEVGVGLAVMAVMVSLYYILSSAGRFDEGL